MTRWLGSLVFVGLLGWTVWSAITLVQPGERAVVRRLGRLLPERPAPGLHVGWPWGIDRVDRVAVSQVRRVAIGYVSADEAPHDTPWGQVLVGDRNLMNVQAEIEYRVREDQVEQFVLNAERLEPVLARCGEAALAEWFAHNTVETALTGWQATLPRFARDRTQARVDVSRLGIVVEQVNIKRIFVPDEVKSDFELWTKSLNRGKTLQTAAKQQAESRVSEAKTQVANGARDAATDAASAVVLARAEAEVFLQRLKHYQDMTRTDPDVINTLWRDGMNALYAALRERGRIDVLDHFLSSEGLTITDFPLRKKN
jgi:membrane protease subunit HflK